MQFAVYNTKSGEILFTGSKEDCKHFRKCRRYPKDVVGIRSYSPPTIENKTSTYYTTAPEKPKGFFKRILFGKFDE